MAMKVSTSPAFAWAMRSFSPAGLDWRARTNRSRSATWARSSAALGSASMMSALKTSKKRFHGRVARCSTIPRSTRPAASSDSSRVAWATLLAFEGEISLAVTRYQISGRRCRKSRRSEEHTSELLSHSDLVCRLLLEKKKKIEVVAGLVAKAYRYAGGTAPDSG